MTANATPNLIATALAHAEALEKARAAATQGTMDYDADWSVIETYDKTICEMCSGADGGDMPSPDERDANGRFIAHAANSTHTTVEILRGLVARVQELEKIADEAIEEFGSTIGYVSKYFDDKWGYTKKHARLKAELATLTPAQGD